MNQSNPIIFEQPLSERIRTFLRLEQLFERIDFHTNKPSKWDTHSSMTTFFEILTISARGDLKSEVMKELERQYSSLAHLSKSPDVDTLTLESLLVNHKSLIESLHNQKGHIGNHIGSTDFLNTVKQRAMVSGSTCSFDLPAYYHWLSMPSEMRQQAFLKWLKPLQNVKKAIDTSLNVIRESGHFEETTAQQGYFQEALKGNRQLQLIRVSIDRSENIYPEISAGKMRYSIRFFSRDSIEEKAAQVMADVNFKMSTCTL